jgi:hypothetical protein
VETTADPNGVAKLTAALALDHCHLADPERALALAADAHDRQDDDGSATTRQFCLVAVGASRSANGDHDGAHRDRMAELVAETDATLLAGLTVVPAWARE